MASITGRKKSYDSRRVQVVRLQESRARRGHALRIDRGRTHQQKGPPQLNEIEEKRRDFIFEVLRTPVLRSVRVFGIMWSPNCEIAPGPSIEGYRYIFDRYVGTSWTVSVVYNIDGAGTPGWLFEK